MFCNHPLPCVGFFSAMIQIYNPLWGWFNLHTIMATLSSSGCNWGAKELWTTNLFALEQTKVKSYCKIFTRD